MRLARRPATPRAGVGGRGRRPRPGLLEALPGPLRPSLGRREMTAGPWRVEAHRGSAAEFHARDSCRRRSGRVVAGRRPAGSGARLHAARVRGGRRRIGGGRRRAGPAPQRRGSGAARARVEVLWVDVIVPRRRRPVGRRRRAGPRGGWATRGRVRSPPAVWPALRSTGAAMVRTPWSRLVCFAGLGPGEVHVGGRKVVGISQRRTRGWARFQCAAYRRWDPEALVPLLADPRPAVEDLAATVLELDTPTADLRAALDRRPRPSRSRPRLCRRIPRRRGSRRHRRR